jgi:7,8-dihydroneopterin aldolase/epimerase/oxygenase
MSKISIVDLEVFFSVGVSDAERAAPQRLLVSVEMTLDITTPSVSDRLAQTINYYTVAQRLLNYGAGRSWKLLEKLTSNMADTILTEFKPDAVAVEVKKFSIPQARYVSVSVTRKHPLFDQPGYPLI